MPKRIHSKKLLVEGAEDKRVIPELIEANGIIWGETANDAIVYIEEFGGISTLFKPGVIESQLKASGLEIMGIIVDANSSAEKRYHQIRDRCIAQFPDIPKKLPQNGLILTNKDGVKLGVWLMPDNQSHGMLETFLMFLAPNADDPVVAFAEKASKKALDLGAPYKTVHGEKAKIHTWLAWQDEPGAQLHQAVKMHVLNPLSPYAAPFVDWFRRLFEV